MQRAVMILAAAVGVLVFPARETIADPGPNPTSANAGWYLGAGVARTRFVNSGSAFNDLNSQVGNGVAFGGSDTDTGYKGFIGYRYENWAVETGYMNTGNLKFSSSALPSGMVSGNIKINIWHLDIIGNVPIGGQGFSAYGRLGLALAGADRSYSGNAGGTQVQADDTRWKLAPKAGVGLELDFARSLGLRAEWSRIFGVGNHNTGKTDVDFYGADFIIKF